MHLIALLIISITCAMIGQYAAYALKERTILLKKAEIMVSFIRSQINYVAVPSYELVDLLAEREDFKDLDFVKQCKGYISQGLEFPIAWSKALEKYKYQSCMVEKDIQILLDFGKNFGVTDADGQISHCNLYIELLSTNYVDALKAKERYSGVVSGLGFLFGIGVLIVFL